MFSAKKIAGQKLYDLARKGVTIDRAAVKVHLSTTLLAYNYPKLDLKVACSKGTYIRALANDLGNRLKTGAFLSFSIPNPLRNLYLSRLRGPGKNLRPRVRSRSFSQEPIMTALTIGVFDGVHQGHQLLLRFLQKTKAKTIVLTFSNHPSDVLTKKSPPLLTSLPLKRALLKTYGVDNIIEIPFTSAIANQSFEEFLKPYPIRYLILGEGAAFGKSCRGTPESLEILGKERGFTVHVQPLLQINHQPLSSSRIRNLIANGQMNEAEQLLGRSHCIFLNPSSYRKNPENRKYAKEAALSLPPDGSYPVWLHSSRGVEEAIIDVQNSSIESLLDDPHLISFGPNLPSNLFSNVIDDINYRKRVKCCESLNP